MTRVFICEEWSPITQGWKHIFCTDSAACADRWRRNGIKGYNRKFVDYVVLNAEEVERTDLLTVPKNGENQEL